MSPCCCSCPGAQQGGGAGKSSLPLICLVPRDDKMSLPGGSGRTSHSAPDARATSSSPQHKFKLLSDEELKKYYKMSPRALYMDPFRRPLITFPMTQEESKNFNMYRKTKINQQILDGFLDPSESLMSPSIFPYATSSAPGSDKKGKDDEEIIYILQLPDYEYKCPMHGEIIRTPRFIWHSCKKTDKGAEGGGPKRGGGPTNKPKPWLLSRLTDYDLLSQW